MIEKKSIKKILIIAGTGAIGAHLVEILKGSQYEVYVTSRKEHQSNGNINFLRGNAHDKTFLQTVLNNQYVAIYDFMIWKYEEFEEILSLFLDVTEQYFFISSCRCYAESDHPLIETSPKLLDVCNDMDYLASDDYALTKTRQENILRRTGKNNWTIVRPYLTYSEQRLPLCILEQYDWFLRAMKSKSIVFFDDLANKYTTLTYGKDVANVLFKLLGVKGSLGEDFNVTSDLSIKWGDVLKIYTEELSKISGKKVAVKLLPTVYEMDWLVDKWKLQYDRGYNRRFNNGKLFSVIGQYEFVKPEKGLRQCVRSMYMNPIHIGYSISRQAKFDKLSGEWSYYSEFGCIKDYVSYFKWRAFSPHTLAFLLRIRNLFKQKE